jgi:hypothetical protein
MNNFDVIYEKLTTMAVQDFVSIIAASIAILAALYARWSARAAERANEIAIHAERLRIFKTIRHFQDEIETGGLNFPDAAQVQLIQGAELAEFYFSPNLANALKKLVDQSQDFISARAQAFVQDTLGQPILPVSARESLSEVHREILSRVKGRLDEMKRDLRLVRF